MKRVAGFSMLCIGIGVIVGNIISGRWMDLGCVVVLWGVGYYLMMRC